MQKVIKTAFALDRWVVGWESKREKNWYFWDKHWFTVNDNGAVGRKDDYWARYRASWPFVFLKVYESKGNIAKSNSSGGSGGSLNPSEIK